MPVSWELSLSTGETTFSWIILHWYAWDTAAYWGGTSCGQRQNAILQLLFHYFGSLTHDLFLLNSRNIMLSLKLYIDPNYVNIAAHPIYLLWKEKNTNSSKNWAGSTDRNSFPRPFQNEIHPIGHRNISMIDRYSHLSLNHKLFWQDQLSEHYSNSK
jgi:hypothetical protein